MLKLKKVNKSFIGYLIRIVGRSNISQSKKDITKHSKDWSFHKASVADVVVWPQNTKQVSKILKFANQYIIPVTAWGGGSSLEGNPIPIRGGIVLDMSKMNKILAVIENDLQVRVQPGVVSDTLNRYLTKYGLFFPVIPGSSFIATVGGMIANNSGGIFTLKFGVVDNWVLKLKVVLANGDIISVGSRSFKSVSGYNLKSLFVGSEGTLGVITEAVLKLTALPKDKTAAMVSFDNVVDVIKITLDILKSDLEPTAVEFMDKIYMYYVNKVKETKLPQKPTLIIEFHGNKNINLEQLKKLKTLCKENGCIFYREYITSENLKRLSEYRQAVRPALKKILSNMGVLSAEVGLPISCVSGFLKKAEEVSKKYGLQTIMFGHIADGNFHGWALYELNNEEAWVKVINLNEELIQFAIGVGGTTTGEHGVGIGKSKFLPVEHPTDMSLMKEIKKLLDPNGILNPGKIFPDN